MKNVAYYSDRTIERAVLQRQGGLALNPADPCHLVVFTWQDKFLFKTKSLDPYFSAAILSGFMDLVAESVFLGSMDKKYVFSIDLSDTTLEQVTNCLGETVAQDLREVVLGLDRKTAALLAYGKGMQQWHKTHRYCGSCGSSTMVQELGHSRQCTHSVCARMIYPRLDPAVIVLVEHRPTQGPALCLLSKVATANGYMCSTFAGFVEVGETLEDAVVREMKEEIGLSVDQIRYVASQPWPFPASMMVGFTARADSMDYKLDNQEIKCASWFTAKELTELVRSNTLQLSRVDSIARFLIENWIEDNLEEESARDQETFHKCRRS